MAEINTDPNLKPQGAGWVTAKKVEVVPSSVRPGDTVTIRGVFQNASLIPAYAELQFLFDGMKIWEWCSLLACGGFFGSREETIFETSYTIPEGVREGMHRIIAMEKDQSASSAPYADLTVLLPPPPGKGKVSFVSDPAGAAIYVNDNYAGNAPVVAELEPGQYNIKGVHGDKTLTDKITVKSGDLFEYKFTFVAGEPIDWTKYATYGVAAVVAIGTVYLIAKHPQESKAMASEAYKAAQRGYEAVKKRAEYL